MTASPPKLPFAAFYHHAYVKACSELGDRNLHWSIYFDRLRWSLSHPPQSVASYSAAVAVEKLHTSDLYVACAATHGDGCGPFLELYRRHFLKLASRICGSVDLGDEVADKVLANLFVPNRRKRLPLDTYDGWASLEGWLSTVVIHAVQKECRHQNPRFQCLDDLPEQADTAPLRRIDERLRERTYGDSILAAQLAAVRQLTKQQRAVLLLCYEQGVRANEAARTLSISSSTVCRETQRAIRKLREEILRLLARTWDEHFGDIDECVREILENPAYSILALIREAASE